MNLLASLLWLPFAPVVFGWLQAPSAWGLGSLGLSALAAAACALSRTRPSRGRRVGAWVGIGLYAVAAVVIVALDALPGPGLRAATLTRTFSALPAAPGHDFVPHPYPTLHVIPTGERRSAPAWTVWSGGRGVAGLTGALFVIDHPTYGLVIYETSTAFDADAGPLLRSAGLDPSQVRTIIAAGFAAGPGIAARTLPAPWIMADSTEPRPHGPTMERLHPIRYADNPGFGPYAHYFDLAGDGSILMVSSPGPSPGHVGLLLRLRWGSALLPGDAAPTRHNLSSRSTALPPSRATSRALGGALWMQEHHPRIVVIPGWDPASLVGFDRPDVTLHGPH